MNLKVLFNIFTYILGKQIDTVPDVDLDLYKGKWLQVATSRSTKLLGTGVDYKNVTAEYLCINNCSSNVISVFNEGINNNNKYTCIRGYSYCTNNSVPSKRKVVFEGVKFEGNYWIVKLGPVVDRKYDYAIVSGPISNLWGTRFSLYVLCRDKQRYIDNYENDVKQWCIDNGYIYWWNKYIETYK